MKVYLIIGLLFISGCEYVPAKTYEVQTTTGDTIVFSCPTVPLKSPFTYIIEHDCRLVTH